MWTCLVEIHINLYHRYPKIWQRDIIMSIFHSEYKEKGDYRLKKDLMHNLH